MSDNLTEAQVNEELEKSFLKAQNDWKGVIVFEHLTERFLFMPIDGFPMGETFEEQCPDIDINKKNLTIGDRMKTFKLKIGDDDYGADARLFLRVQVGCEKEFIDGIVFYLNRELRGMTGDVEKSYKALVWAHYHTMFKDQMLTKRKVENLVWPLNPRQVFGASIKYDKDIVVYGQRVVCRERNPDSVVTAASMLSGPSSIPKAGGPELDPIPEEIPPPLSRKGLEAAMSKKTAPDKAPEEVAAVTAEVESGVQASDEDKEPEVLSPKTSGTDVGDPPTTRPTPKKPAAKIEVTDQEIKDELENVDVKTDLGPKLVKLYDELPDSANDIPTQSTDDLKDFLIRLRPFENAYRKEANLKSLTRMYKKTKMTPTIVKSEVNRVVDLIDAKLIHKEEMEKKRWEEAKKKALQKKRNAHRREMAKAKRDEEAKAAASAKVTDQPTTGDASDTPGKDTPDPKLVADRSSRAPSTESIRKIPVVEEADKDKSAGGLTKGGPGSEQSSSSTIIDTQEKTSSGSSSASQSENREKSKDKSSDESPEETYVPRLTTKRLMPPPAEVKLPSAPRTKRVPGDPVDAYTILSEVRTLVSRFEKLDSTVEALRETHSGKLKLVADALKCIDKDLKEIKVENSKQTMANQLEMADAEHEINKYAPFDKISPGMKILLENPVSAKVLSQHIWLYLSTSGYDDPTLSDVVIQSTKLIFSLELRAAMFVDSGQPINTEEAKKGWFRTPVPEGYMNLMDRYVLPIWKKRGGKTATPKSPLVRGRSWHKILKEHLENTRKRYFKWSARDAKTLDQWVVARHDAMLHLYTKNQDPDKEAIAAKPASLAQERKWYTETSNRVSHVDDLKEVEIRYEGAKLTWLIGDPADDIEEIESAINRVQSLQYGIPAFLSDYMAGEKMNASRAEEVFKETMLEKQGGAKFRALAATKDEDLEDVDDAPVFVEPGQSDSRGQRRSATGSTPPASPKKKARTTPKKK